MGFVIAKGLDRDILVRPNDFNTALHGDSVLVKITQSKGRQQQGAGSGGIGGRKKTNRFSGPYRNG